MTSLIRSATPADLPAILAIYNDAVLHTTASYDEEPTTIEERTAWYAGRTNAGFPVLVAELDGEVAGYSSYGPFRAKPGYRYTVEHSVYVGAEWRGRGLGRALLLPLIEQARAAGLHAIVGGLDGENAVSLRLHQSLGFVEVGRFRQVGRKFGRWLDLVFVELLLDTPAPAPDDRR